MTSVAAGHATHGRGPRKNANGAAQAVRATRQARAAVARDFETLIADAEHLLHSTADVVGDQAAQARARLERTLTAARDRVAEDVDSLTEHGREAVAAADDYVHRKPWQVLGVATIAAIAAGFFLSRR